MICDHCQKESTLHDGTCPYCGKPFVEAAPPTITYIDDTEDHPKAKKAIIGFMTLYALTVIACIFGFILFANYDKNHIDEKDIPAFLTENDLSANPLGNTPANSKNLGYLLQTDGGFYYTDRHTIRFRAENGEETLIKEAKSDLEYACLDRKGNDLYYVKQSYDGKGYHFSIAVYDTETKGESTFLQAEDTVYQLKILGDVLYYVTTDKIIAVDLATKEQWTVVDNKGYKLDAAISEYGIYWFDYHYNGLFRCDLDGRSQTEIGKARDITLDGPYLYTVEPDDSYHYNNIFRTDLRTDEKTLIRTLEEEVYRGDLSAKEQLLCYEKTENDTAKLILLNTENGEETILYESPATDHYIYDCLNMGDDAILYITYDNNKTRTNIVLIP